MSRDRVIHTSSNIGTRVHELPLYMYHLCFWTTSACVANVLAPTGDLFYSLLCPTACLSNSSVADGVWT